MLKRMCLSMLSHTAPPRSMPCRYVIWVDEPSGAKLTPAYASVHMATLTQAVDQKSTLGKGWRAKGVQAGMRTGLLTRWRGLSSSSKRQEPAQSGCYCLGSCIHIVMLTPNAYVVCCCRVRSACEQSHLCTWQAMNAMCSFKSWTHEL